MKSNCLKKGFRSNASALHRRLGDLLQTTEPWKRWWTRTYQEYPVKKINPDYPDNRAKVDWYIKDMSLVIEVMGAQHRQPVTFGGTTEEAEIAFDAIKRRDTEKRNYVEDAGCIQIDLHDNQIPEDIPSWLWTEFSKQINGKLKRKRAKKKNNPKRRTVRCLQSS